MPDEIGDGLDGYALVTHDRDERRLQRRMALQINPRRETPAFERLAGQLMEELATWLVSGPAAAPRRRRRGN
ncbi:hypothetical protein GCM10023334_112000 [Nonomuraea thailandensis]